MTKKFKKSYKFALKSAFYITLFVMIALVVETIIFNSLSYWSIFSILLVLFAFSFFVLQFRVEKFIYKRIQKLYDDISLLDSTSFLEKSITTDVTNLTKDIRKFAKEKKIEIESLKVQEEYRREFIGNVAHELKTPLFTVQGYIETLTEGGAIKDKELRKKYLNRALNGVERLINIVEDLDMITKLESNSMQVNYQTFDIVKEVQKVFDMLEIKAEEKGIILMFDEKYNKPINVYADQDKIHQVLINLIMNSVKYGAKNGTTEVGFERILSNKILIRVIDNGEGIAKENLGRIFERFYRVDKSGSRKEGGSGLGLSIVKHIIEAHNEKILVQSTLSKGSEFSFTLKNSK